MEKEMKYAVVPEQCEGMEYLVDLGRERTDIRVVNIDGENYTTDNLHRIEKVYPPRPETFKAATLDGFVTYLQSGVDFKAGVDILVIVSVVAPNYVVAYGPVCGEDMKRDKLAYCLIETPRLDTNRYMDPESFNVMLQTHVIQSASRDLVLKFVGSLKDEQSNQTADDGFSQRVTVKTGVASVGEVTVVNPVPLAPRRTFPEIEQPESNYVLRFREGPQAALFSTDDLTWQHTAIASIGNWLRERLGDGFIVVA